VPAFRVAFHTLGCKLNQLETESIAQAFLAEGFPVVGWGERADLLVVNTCTVTSKAEQKARRVIRKALKDSPSACLIATGCYAQLDPAALAAVADRLDEALEGETDGGAGSGGVLADRRRLTVVSGDDKAALLDLPAYMAANACSSAELPGLVAAWAAGDRSVPSSPGGSIRQDRFRFDAADFAFHSRASLKIQDGCDNACAYCRVRLARGGSVSLPAEEAVRRLALLEERGYAEAVLTGVNVSRYRDSTASGGVDFPGLITRLLAGTASIALRISSTEPDGVDAAFASAVADPRVRPHFHLSVQSGSDAVLARMRRRYRAEAVERAAERLRAAKGDPFLACDIIAGFPGETEADFEASYELCRRIGFAWIHAFPFSPRPGTAAASMDGRVPERTAAERVARLTDLAASGHRAYVGRWLGRTVEAVMETGPGSCALSENYLKLRLEAAAGAAPSVPGSRLRCVVSAELPDCGAAADASAYAI
jgi:threonylcarbamoyladenosine tRNA methylthiotransferase MtaB